MCLVVNPQGPRGISRWEGTYNPIHPNMSNLIIKMIVNLTAKQAQLAMRHNLSATFWVFTQPNGTRVTLSCFYRIIHSLRDPFKLNWWDAQGIDFMSELGTALALLESPQNEFNRIPMPWMYVLKKPDLVSNLSFVNEYFKAKWDAVVQWSENGVPSAKSLGSKKMILTSAN